MRLLITIALLLVAIRITVGVARGMAAAGNGGSSAHSRRLLRVATRALQALLIAAIAGVATDALGRGLLGAVAFRKC
jgi:hypothetical protein